MRAYTFKEHIDRPPARVWDVLTDLTLAARWRPLVVSIETVGGEPLRVGTKVKIVTEFLGRRSEHVSTTTVFEPGKRWTLHSQSTPQIEGWFDFLLEPEGTGTRVTATCDLKAHGFLPWLFMPLIARGERTRRVELLPNLKRLVESEHS